MLYVTVCVVTKIVTQTFFLIRVTYPNNRVTYRNINYPNNRVTYLNIDYPNNRVTYPDNKVTCRDYPVITITYLVTRAVGIRVSTLIIGELTQINRVITLIPTAPVTG